MPDLPNGREIWRDYWKSVGTSMRTGEGHNETLPPWPIEASQSFQMCPQYHHSLSLRMPQDNLCVQDTLIIVVQSTGNKEKLQPVSLNLWKRTTWYFVSGKHHYQVSKWTSLQNFRTTFVQSAQVTVLLSFWNECLQQVSTAHIIARTKVKGGKFCSQGSGARNLLEYSSTKSTLANSHAQKTSVQCKKLQFPASSSRQLVANPKEL